MQTSTFRSEERIGLLVAFALHVLLVIVLLVQPRTVPEFEPAERMTVNLATDVGMAATAPEPVAESRAAEAPTLSDTPAPAPELDSPPLPSEPVARPVERVQAPAPAPRPVARPRPAPAPARAQPRERPRPQPSAAPARAPAREAARPAQPARPAERAGGSRLGDNFLEGAGSSTTTTETRVPASQIGASAKASLVQAIAREIKPHWQPPSGPDVEKITTYLRFRLKPDGSLEGRPAMVRQTGVNDTNRAQAGRHAEQAIRAVQLAAPFNLPEEYYEAWKLVNPFSFDWNLAQ